MEGGGKWVWGGETDADSVTVWYGRLWWCRVGCGTLDGADGVVGVGLGKLSHSIICCAKLYDYSLKLLYRSSTIAVTVTPFIFHHCSRPISTSYILRPALPPNHITFTTPHPLIPTPALSITLPTCPIQPNLPDSKNPPRPTPPSPQPNLTYPRIPFNPQALTDIVD